MKRVVRLFTLGALVTTFVGCGGDDDTDASDVGGPEFAGGGYEAGARLDYPDGPFGYEVGRVIENLKFRGFGQPRSGENIGVLQLIQLAEFYNPTGDGVFGPGSPMGEGNPKPKAMSFAVGAVWCPPCNTEAREVLPEKYEEFLPKGGTIVSVLGDGPTPGEPARVIHVTNWIKRYDVEYPMLLDPTDKMQPLFENGYLPTNFIIRTTDMVIIDIRNSVRATSSYWTLLDETIATAPVTPAEPQ